MENTKLKPGRFGPAGGALKEMKTSEPQAQTLQNTSLHPLNSQTWVLIVPPPIFSYQNLL